MAVPSVAHSSLIGPRPVPAFEGIETCSFRPRKPHLGQDPGLIPAFEGIKIFQ